MGSFQKQGSLFTYQFYHNGKKFRRTTGTGDLRLAKQKAKLIEDQVKSASGLVELEETKKKKSFPKIGEICEAYLSGSSLRSLSGQKMALGTAKRNVAELLKMVDADDSITILTQFVLSRLTGLSGRALVRARNTIEAIHRRARSIFAGWSLKIYSDNGLMIPSAVLEWKKYRAVAEDHGTYRVPIELALRAKEIVNLKWNWFVPRGEHYALLIIDRPSEEFTAKGTNREIQVHRKLYEKLISLGNDSEFICPGTTENARMNYITRVLADWIRCIGWSVDIFPKAGYELRKLKGSDWFTKLGPAVAQEWLGHKSIETTMKYYACLATPPPPPAPEW